jgi:hypothetical protein
VIGPKIEAVDDWAILIVEGDDRLGDVIVVEELEHGCRAVVGVHLLVNHLVPVKVVEEVEVPVAYKGSEGVSLKLIASIGHLDVYETGSLWGVETRRTATLLDRPSRRRHQGKSARRVRVGRIGKEEFWSGRGRRRRGGRGVRGRSCLRVGRFGTPRRGRVGLGDLCRVRRWRIGGLGLKRVDDECSGRNGIGVSCTAAGEAAGERRQR